MVEFNIPTFVPKCPMCGADLEGLPFPMVPKGVGRCPAGNVMVEFEIDIDEENVVKDKDGNINPSIGWKVTGSKH